MTRTAPAHQANTKQMTYDGQTSTFVAEASDLGIPAGPMPRQIIVTSHWTGRKLTFDLKEVKRDGTPDNEIVAWVYECPGPRFRLDVLND